MKIEPARVVRKVEGSQDLKLDIPFNFVKFNGVDKAAISARNDYGYGCILSVYEKIKARLSAENICISDTTVRPRRDLRFCNRPIIMNQSI